MNDIEIRTRREGHAPEQRDDRLVLKGEREWLLRGPAAEVAAIRRALPGIAEALGDGLLLLNFGNAVGRFNLPGLGLVEIVSGKWDETHFEQMLRELTETAVSLPFSADITAALPYDRALATHEHLLYHMFVYLRHILSDAAPLEEQLIPAINLILQAPHQRLERLRRNVALEHVRQIDPAGLTRIVEGHGGLVRVAPFVDARLPLARALQSHLPERVGERYVEVSHDTAENRFVKSFLRSLQGIIDQMRELMRWRKDDPFRQRIEGDCESMALALGPVTRHRLWDEVGTMTHLPASSPVLQRRRGYREAYRHFARLRMAAQIPLDESVTRDLLEAKDIALLYELWTFFTLVREVEQHLGPPAVAGRPRQSPLEVTIEQGLEVRWHDGTALVYNQTFSRSRQGVRHSYSVPLRPDITFYISGGHNAGVHLLDAKFKVETLDELMPATDVFDMEAERGEERRGTFKRADLYKMHTYRDAIREARSVWILYPGTERHFFSDNSKVTNTSDQLPDLLRGVGAIPLAPGKRAEKLREMVACLLG